MNELIEALRNMDAESGDRALDALVIALTDLLREGQNRAQRSLAAGILGDIGDARALAGLQAALTDPHVTVRYAAASALLQLKTTGAAAAVRELLTDPDAGIRRMVLVALVDEGMIAGATADDFIPFLNDHDPFVRQQAILALRALADHPQTLPHLLHHLHDPDSRVALEAAAALADTHNPNAIAPLFAVANDETAYYLLRGAAVSSLVILGIDTRRLLSLLDVPDVYIRRRVIEAVRTLTTPEQVTHLLNAADWHTSLVRPARDALIRSGGTAVETVMIDALQHLREWVRSLAVEVLGELRSSAAVIPLLAVLNSDEPEIRVLAANALGLIGNPTAVDGLAAALINDRSWLVEMAAASALRRINTPAARAALGGWHSSRQDDSP